MIRGIADRATFGRLRRHGHRVRTADLRASFLPEHHDDLRVAYAIGRKVGTAVVRNRIRRRIRGVLDEHRADLPSGAMLVSVGPTAATLSSAELRSQVEQVLKMITSIETEHTGERA